MYLYNLTLQRASAITVSGCEKLDVLSQNNFKCILGAVTGKQLPPLNFHHIPKYL